jgi:hypothetical protein
MKEKNEAEIVRKKYLYRKLLLNSKIKMSQQGAVKMVGPDCAYHLYRNK